MTRTFAYGMHRKKQILTGKWPYSTTNPDCSNTFNTLFSQNNVYPGPGPGHGLCDDLPSSVPDEEDPPGGVCSAGQCSTRNISVTSEYLCQDVGQDGPPVYRKGDWDHNEILGHSEDVHTVSGDGCGGISGPEGRWEGYLVNISGMHDMQHNSAGIQPRLVCRGGVPGSHGSGDSALGRDSQFFEDASIANFLSKTSAVQTV